MGFVENNNAVAGQQRIREKLAHEHAITDIFDFGLGSTGLVKPDRIPHETAEFHALFRGDTCSKGCSSNATGLGYRDDAFSSESFLEDVLGNFCASNVQVSNMQVGMVQGPPRAALVRTSSFSGTCFAEKNGNVVLADFADEGLPPCQPVSTGTRGS